MPARQYDYNRHKALKFLIGPVWMADLMYLFRRNSPTDLQRLIEGEVVAESDWEIVPAFSFIYNKYDRGKIFPSLGRIERWVQLCGATIRVPELALWDVIGQTPRTYQ